MPNVTRLHLAWRRRLLDLRLAAAAAVLDADRPETAVATVLYAQRSTVGVTDAYLSLEAGLAAGGPTAPWGIDAERIIGRAARGGVFLEDVYGRNWRAEQSSFTERMAREVNTDITLAERTVTWIHTDNDPRIVGHRRVLGAGPNCALCVVAATRTYRSESLRPIHAHCGCTSQPVYRTGPAPRVDRASLDRLYEQAGTTRAAGLGRIEVDPADLPAGVLARDLPAVTVTSHPELGPTLTAA